MEIKPEIFKFYDIQRDLIVKTFDCFWTDQSLITYVMNN